MTNQTNYSVDVDVGGQLRSRPVVPAQNHPRSTGEDDSKGPAQLHVHEQTPLLQRTGEEGDQEGLDSSSQDSAALNAGLWRSRTKASVRVYLQCSSAESVAF